MNVKMVSYVEEDALKIANQAVDLVIQRMQSDGLITAETAKAAECYGVIFVSAGWLRKAWTRIFPDLKQDNISVTIVKL